MASNKLIKNQFDRDYSRDRPDVIKFKQYLDKAMDNIDIAAHNISDIKKKRELQHIKFNISYLKDEEVLE